MQGTCQPGRRDLLAETMLAQTPIQGRPIYPEQLRSPLSIPFGQLDHPTNVLALGGIYGLAQDRWSLLNACQRGRKMPRADGSVTGKYQTALDHVGQFAHVAWPGVGL